MKSFLATVVLLGVSSLTVALGQTVAQPGLMREPLQSPSPALAANYGKLPLSFEANQGQTDAQVRFLSRGQGYSLFLTDSAAVLALSAPVAPNRQRSSAASSKSDVVRMELAGAARDLRVTGDQALPGKTNYFIGNDPAKWHSNVSTYARVKYTGVYPGVDLLYYGNQRQLEYDFVVAAGADPKPVRLRFSGASKLTLDADGDLLVSAKNGQIAFHKPVIYQIIKDGQTKDGQRQPVSGSFKLMAGNTIGFTVGSYDHMRELVIDPVLAYSTYLGGTGTDIATGIAVDKSGNAYLVGSTSSLDFPVTDYGFQTASKELGTAFTVFVAKLNPSGSSLEYCTYLGGSGANYTFGRTPGDLQGNGGDLGSGIAVDMTGHAYVTGTTWSADFPVTAGAFQTIAPEALDSAFIAELNPEGSGLIYSTYLSGGVSQSQAYAIALDSAGHAFVTGSVGRPSGSFPVTPGAFMTVTDVSNSFLTKLNSDGSALLYSTYLGPYTGGCFGAEGASSAGIAVDALDQAYLTGSTGSGLPVTADAYQATASASCNAFAMKLNSAGSAVVYATYIGGNPGGVGRETFGGGIAVDSQGNAYLAGTTDQAGFPTTDGAFLPEGGSDKFQPFVTKFNSTGSSLIYSTFLEHGGGFTQAVALDALGQAYVAGVTYQGGNLGFDQVFLAVLNQSGSARLSNQTLGTPSEGTIMNPLAVALDPLGNVYIAGAASSGFPVTPGAFQPQFLSKDSAFGIPGGSNAFAAKFAFNGATTTTTSSDNNPEDFGAPVTFSASVKPVAGNHVPTGDLIFIVDGVKAPILPLDGDGNVSYSPVDLPVGVHRVIASYIGDPAKYSGSSNELTQTVIGQVAEPTFGAIGGTFKAPAIVKIETVTPGASIYYTLDGSNPGTSSNLYSAPFVVSTTTTIKAIAILSGDTPSPIATATFTILPPAIATTTVLASSPNPSTSGQPVTFTATVTAASGPAPTGFVTFKHTAVVIGTAPLIGGVAQLTVSNLDPVDHAVTATYTGNSVDNHSTSAVLWQLVNP